MPRHRRESKFSTIAAIQAQSNNPPSSQRRQPLAAVGHAALDRDSIVEVRALFVSISGLTEKIKSTGRRVVRVILLNAKVARFEKASLSRHGNRYHKVNC